MKNDCSVVKDLIPLYEEGLVSEETKEFIDEHCQSCENCKNLLENLAKSYHEQETNDNKKEKIWGEIASKERKRKKKRYLTLSLTSVILKIKPQSFSENSSLSFTKQSSSTIHPFPYIFFAKES